MLQCHADQLAVAVRSPFPALEKQYHGAATLIGQGPRFASLVKQREVRRLIHQPNLGQIVDKFDPNAVGSTNLLALGGRGMPPIDVRVLCLVLIVQPQLSTAVPSRSIGGEGYDRRHSVRPGNHLTARRSQRNAGTRKVLGRDILRATPAEAGTPLGSLGVCLINQRRFSSGVTKCTSRESITSRSVRAQRLSRQGLHSRFPIVSMTCLGAMWDKYRSVVTCETWPSWRWMIGIGTPSIINSYPWV
jgi:hypothetical protein